MSFDTQRENGDGSSMDIQPNSPNLPMLHQSFYFPIIYMVVPLVVVQSYQFYCQVCNMNFQKKKSSNEIFSTWERIAMCS
eukprot:UN15369